MLPSIPASQLVSVLPGVLQAGGNPLSLNGLFLTTDISVPMGTVAEFPSAEAVADFFGASTREAEMASIYFDGFDISTTKPSNIMFAQYNTAAVAAYLRGGSLAGMTLAALQLLSGTLTLTINGTAYTTASINLSSATSFSNAATLIQTALAGALASTTCVYDSTRNAFLIKSPTTGAASTITFATANSIANGLKLTSVLGAVTSQGADVAVQSTFMNAILGKTQNWASFLTVFEPNDAAKLLFSAWVNGQNDRFVYVAWDTSLAPGAAVDPTCFGALVTAAEYDGTCPVFDLTGDIAAFVAGSIASIDFAATNGRIDFAYKRQAGLTPNVTDATTYANYIANGYNVYARFATSNDRFTDFQPGSIPGQWRWLDSYVNNIWLNAALQLAFMNFLESVNSVPYNQSGYNQLRVVVGGPVDAALNAGVIQKGVALSNSQRASINTAVGSPNAAQVVVTLGWFLDVKDADSLVRAARGSPPMVLYYADGGSIQKIELSSIEVQ
jgi:hypothetical protein